MISFLTLRFYFVSFRILKAGLACCLLVKGSKGEDIVDTGRNVCFSPFLSRHDKLLPCVPSSVPCIVQWSKSRRHRGDMWAWNGMFKFLPTVSKFRPNVHFHKGLELFSLPPTTPTHPKTMPFTLLLSSLISYCSNFLHPESTTDTSPSTFFEWKI